MVEAAVIVFRWLQYGGGVVLLGAPLFLLYSFRGVDDPTLAWTRPMLVVATIAVAFAALAALVAQTAVMAGSLAEGLKPASLSFMVTGTALGMAMVARAAVALLGLVLVVVLQPGRALWGLLVMAGLAVTASFAWTGHGAATEGPGGFLHLTADIVHAGAAALWLGALAALTILLLRRTAPDDPAIHRALHGFAGAGTMAVVLLVVTGLVNSWFLVGPARVGEIGTSLYGQLLIAKLALFAVMLALAAGNRFRLTPALGSVLAVGAESRQALRRLRHGVIAETLVGVGLLAVVAMMGTLPPPSAM
ncbi:MAG: copper homeostasis membrane protein CopD [Brevundimonas sp.]|uniref:copper homeostasis membrane protein CopD n=1 Tax=Brevundimonas sp. TaxID=1871086 RepID=UPI0027261109|nr:copper homeostasis membrane protein CopD [Brevundimonas sp.]MDO9588148.1 copper homeostasis membrane protein CopD [Brevundimonas sp.]MDP3655889.1 copper homeostasis membrane protein CopD [Brevundimonas sp.]MDZ4108891.1 copper homeostasis membrane protein CopD [Brevundimonas sp.]